SAWATSGRLTIRNRGQGYGLSSQQWNEGTPPPLSSHKSRQFQYAKRQFCMEGRGRKSTASLTVLKGGAGSRIEPPKGMAKSQRELWDAVVGSKPADWFGPDNAPLLVEYVRAVDMANKLERQIEVLTSGDEADAGMLKE